MIKFCIGHDSVLVDTAVYDLREKSQTSHSVKVNFDSFLNGKLCNQNRLRRRKVVSLLREKKKKKLSKRSYQKSR